MVQNSKTKQAITLKLSDFSQIGISKIWNFVFGYFRCFESNQFVESGSLGKVKNDQNRLNVIKN